MYKIAKDVILMFAKSMRHGLDAQFFWTALVIRGSIAGTQPGGLSNQSETTSTSQKTQISWKKKSKCLSCRTIRKSMKKNVPAENKKSWPWRKLYSKFFQCHASGIHFREWNAGDQIDWKHAIWRIWYFSWTWWTNRFRCRRKTLITV